MAIIYLNIAFGDLHKDPRIFINEYEISNAILAHLTIESARPQKTVWAMEYDTMLILIGDCFPADCKLVMRIRSVFRDLMAEAIFRYMCANENEERYLGLGSMYILLSNWDIIGYNCQIT